MGVKERFYYHVTSLNPEVTGSLHLVTVNYPDGRKTNFAVECGSYQEGDYNDLNHKRFPFAGEHIDFVLITHNHADHMGRLPYLVSSGFTGNIYTTDMTACLMQPALEDSFSILKEEVRKHNKAMIYDECDLAKTLSHIQHCDFEAVQYVDRNIKVTFFMNAHILGASMILVKISCRGEQDINLFFTGDYRSQNIFFETDELPQWVLELPLTIITEATYGYMNRNEISYHMENDLEKAIQEEKTVLVTVFAQGRAQEIMYMLKDMQKHGKISTKIPIKLDGKLAQEYTRMYMGCDLLEENGKNDFLPENFSFITKENREGVLQDGRQQIVLTTSGMADHGPAPLYLERWIGREDVLIYIPGYTSPDTLGYKLQHPVDGMVRINNKMRSMRAKVLTTNEWSSHAKADEIIEFLNQFKKLNTVLINHGQNDVKQQFAERVLDEVNAKYVGVLGEYTFKISAYGNVKCMPSNLKCPEMEKGKWTPSSKKSKDCKKNRKKLKIPFVTRAYRR